MSTMLASKFGTALIAIACLSSGASAQTTTAAPTMRSGGLGGLLGSAVPSVGSIGAGNAAGLLGYCLKNNLLGQGSALGALAGGQAMTPQAATPQAITPATGAQSILQRLTGRQGVTTSPGYAAGQAGQLQTPNGQGLSLGNLGGQVKTRMCSVVLNRAKSFL